MVDRRMTLSALAITTLTVAAMVNDASQMRLGGGGGDNTSPRGAWPGLRAG